MSAVEIFLCYAHEDEVLLKKLESHLRLLQRQGLINIWHDRNINAGTEWACEIDKHLNFAQIILLLISPDFMDSDYCYSIEMQRAMQRHERGEARVIPIIFRPVYWEGAPFGKLQVLPTDAIPVTSPKWHDLDEAFLDVLIGIRTVVQEYLHSMDGSDNPPHELKPNSIRVKSPTMDGSDNPPHELKPNSIRVKSPIARIWIGIGKVFRPAVNIWIVIICCVLVLSIVLLRMSAFLVAHGLFIVGTLLIIISTGYMGYGFLNVKFLRRLSQGFIYGLVGGIIGGVPIMIVLFLFLLLFIILLLIEDIFIPGIFASAHVGESAKAALSLSTTGFLFGLGIGFLTGIVSHQKEELAFLKISSRRNIFLLFLLGVLFAVLYTVYEVYSNQGDSVILLIVSLYGFVLGTLFGSVKFTWINWASGLISSFVAVVVVLRLGYLSQSLNSIIVDSLILVSTLIFSLLSGYVFFNQPQFHDPNLDRGSWGKFALWLVIGWTCGFILLLLSNLLLKDVTNLIMPASAIGILIAFGNGEGKKLINEPKPEKRYDHIKERSYPIFSWARFRRGFSIAFIFAFWASSLLYFNYVYFDASVYNLFASLFKQIPDIYPSIDFYVKVSVFAVSLIFGLSGGFITAIIYAYGYVLLAKVEGLLDRRLGQIGFVLFILGILIAALPYLSS